jgi:hypothetical protein
MDAQSVIRTFWSHQPVTAFPAQPGNCRQSGDTPQARNSRESGKLNFDTISASGYNLVMFPGVAMKACPWRRSVIALAALVIFAGPPAFAAPTCQNLEGETVKCGVPGAMPVGWTRQAQERWEQQPEMPVAGNLPQLMQTLCALGIFFALLALMPDFDGSHPGEWDSEEGELRDR